MTNKAIKKRRNTNRANKNETVFETYKQKNSIQKQEKRNKVNEPRTARTFKTALVRLLSQTKSLSLAHKKTKIFLFKIFDTFKTNAVRRKYVRLAYVLHGEK